MDAEMNEMLAIPMRIVRMSSADLMAEISELREALRPFAKHLNAIEAHEPWPDSQWAPMEAIDEVNGESISHITVGDLRKAAKILEK